MKAKKNHLFVDLDGTLVDSLGFFYACYKRFLAHFDVKPSISEFESLNGPSLSQIIEILSERHSLEMGLDELRKLYTDELNNGVQEIALFEDSLGFIDAARERKLGLVLVSSSSQLHGERVLKQCGISDVFDFEVWGDSVKRSKPNPDIYLQALQRAGCNPSEGVAVEDSANGVEAAVKAGLTCFAIARSKKALIEIEGVISISGLTELFDRI